MSAMSKLVVHNFEQPEISRNLFLYGHQDSKNQGATQSTEIKAVRKQSLDGPSELMVSYPTMYDEISNRGVLSPDFASPI